MTTPSRSARSMVLIDPISLLHPTSPPAHIHQLHAHLLISGHLARNPLSLNSLLSFLALSHKTPYSLSYSHLLLSHSPTPPTTFALNTLIRAHSGTSAPHLSFHFYNQILSQNSLSPDNYTFTFLVRACTKLSSLPAGLAVHGSALKRGFGSDPHFLSGLIHLYAELGVPEHACMLYSDLLQPDVVTQTAILGALAYSGRIDDARQMFDKMPSRDHIAWNAMIAGYSQMGRSREALELFSSMQMERVSVSSATMVSVLTACAHLGAIDQGEWAHAYIRRNKVHVTVTLGTALIDMYSKCGDMERAMQVFWEMEEKNVYTWSSAMNGLAMNGFGHRCLQLFQEMKELNVEPNGITFVSVLRGCSFAGLVEEGRQHFDSMKSCYAIEPWLEHYGCMVDLYGRAGLLDDALEVINAMPTKPHVGAWGALLNACRIYKNVELGELAMRKIVELESRNDGAYVQLSNIYADSRNWMGVSRVRSLMKGRRVRKEPGCSVVEVCGELHEFFSGDRSHPRYVEIEAMLGEMSRRLRLKGYSARTNEVMFDIEEEEKENALSWHSEKLAIAFGLIALEDGVTIRIVKNLRMCLDCHDATKFFSNAFGREIVVRDRNRFHHFKDGECSCKDYW